MDIGTVSLGKAAPRLEIDDESTIPTQFWKRNDPTLDKAGLTKAMRERQKALEGVARIKKIEDRVLAEAVIDDEMPVIPGVHMETSGVSLTIRRA
jgi:hypothetical protein